MYRIFAFTKEKKLIQEVEKKILEDVNVEIKINSDILEFLESLLRHYAQLVILDVDLLGENVNKVIDIARSIQKDCKIVLVLSHTNMSICSSALTKGIVSYLIKPISVLSAYKIFLTTLLIDIKDKSKI